MDEASTIHDDPFLAALRELPGMFLLTPTIAEALLHLPAQAFDARRANQEHVPPLMTTEGQRGYLAGDLVQYIEQVPTRRGPIRIHHPSFADFLAHGQPDDVWAFGMVALDFHGMRRPVDLLTCIDFPMALLADAHCRNVTLEQYLASMESYLARFDDQQAAEKLTTERVQLASRHAPPRKGRKKTKIHRS